MNRKQFILLLVVAALIVSAGLVMYQRNNGAWQGAEDSTGRKLLPGLAVNDIAQINMQSGTNILHLARTDNLWRVQERDGYPADFSQISALLLKIADLKIIQNEEIGPSQLGRLELLPPDSATGAGTLVEFKDQNGQSLGSLLLGKKHMKQAAPNASPDGADGGSWPDGRYVMVGAGAKTVAVISDPLDNAQPQPEQWLDKDFLSIERPRTIAAQFPVATNSWKLTRSSETNDWQLADAGAKEKLDSSKISSLTSPFNYVSFNDVAPLAGHANSSSATGTVLTVETFDGLTYVAHIGPKQNDSYPVNFSITGNLSATRTTIKDEKPADKARLDQEFKDQKNKLADKLAREKRYENWIYYLLTYSIDELLKTRNQILLDKTCSVCNASLVNPNL